jgi:branched-chain amino acid transport system permease protein
VTLTETPPRRARKQPGGKPYRELVVDLRQDLRLFPNWWARGGLILLIFLYWYIPTHYMGDSGLRTMSTIGTFAIGAIGLNLLSGYTGQISLGHAFFIGVGSYTVGYLGATERTLDILGSPLSIDLPVPLLVYLPAAAVLGFLLGAVIGPFALRLRGVYLVIVTLGLIFVGRHVFNNRDSVTGGSRGLRGLRGTEVALGPVDFRDLSLFGHQYSSDAGMFFLVWGLVALAAIIAYFWPVGGYYSNLEASVGERAGTYSQLQQLQTRQRQLPIVDPDESWALRNP